MVNNLAGKPVPAQQKEEGVDGALTKKRKLSYSINSIELFEIGNGSGRTAPLHTAPPNPPPPSQSPLDASQGRKSSGSHKGPSLSLEAGELTFVVGTEFLTFNRGGKS